MHTRSTIESLGYSPHEVMVYLAALELGESTATDLAERTQIPRTTVNLIIDTLHKKGLMSSYLQHRRKIWVAENPELLLERLKEHETSLRSILPKLQSLRHDASMRPAVRTYSGAEEIKQIMNDVLETRHNFLAIHSWDDWIILLGQSYMEDFIEQRVRQNLHVKALMPNTERARALRERDAKELRTTQLLPDSLAIDNSNFIYGNKVAIISIKTPHPIGIVIEDESIHHTMTILFEALWKQSEES